MKTVNWTLCSTAVAAALSLPFMTGAVWSQETSQTEEPADQSQDMGQEQASPSPADTAATADSATGDTQPDAIVATVGDAEIRGSDVLTVIGMLPPQLQSQQPQMLVPIALEQLILRELILERARSENLADDAEVTALVNSAAQVAEEDAMVQIWLDRELAGAVTPEAVQQMYDQAQEQGETDLPPLASVQPQIEQHLRQQAMQELRMSLQDGADIVLYDATGRPMEEQAPGGQSGASPDENAENGDQSGSSDAGTEASEDSTSDTSEDAPQSN